MKKAMLLAAGLALLFSCEKNSDEMTSAIPARIVGFDLNCSTCILEFPDDSLAVKKFIGKSPGNYYQTVNLNKGEFSVGQMLKVKLRLPEENEVKACITLYPSYNYRSVFITDSRYFDNIDFNDTIELAWHDCFSTPDKTIYLCLDSVLSDSRCLEGAICIWAGAVTVKFSFVKSDEPPVFFNLSTYPSLKPDTIIDGYKFTLVGLSPYPSLKHKISLSEYKAKLLVEKDL
ncbi:MAG: hypothetical protein WCE64_14970 [Bacteroidales bacterium]